ncbi:lysophospholipid acyltransferase family protein [Mycoplasma sp. SG1]|uniref:lysophospholipid acyltransferase family protein n=1 Tax=Mycoplasma sp. SG1 TaxID=2810348 RepID=UPI0020245BFA|nr:lysophospholipid acyltransferase family protein [Mycoplasma sp. SG1]URM52962.1 1-acyl-sn-glycerol-3-phosphate acyltransferase [Mycoplasma sp. SG1]
MRIWFIPIYFFYFIGSYIKAKRIVKKRLEHKKYTEEYCEKWLLRMLKALRFLHKVKINIIDKDKLPERTSVIVFNHQSWFDIFVLPDILKDRPFSAIVKIELAKGPLSRFVKVFDPIFVNRSDLKSKLNTVSESKTKILDQNLDLVIFPEGTRNKNPQKLLPFFDGLSLISKATMAPIVPIVIYNSAQVKKKFRFHLFKAPKIDVKVLDFVHPNKFLSKDLKIVTKNIQKLIQDELDEYYDSQKT